MTASRGVVVIHYAELGTKGKNRSFFVGVLRRNLRRALVGLEVASIQSRHARIFLEFAAPLDDDLQRELRSRLGAVMGIATFSFATRIPGRPLDRLEREACELVERALGEQAREPGAGGGSVIRTFAVDTRRGDKSFPIPSPEINRRLGAAIQGRTGLGVDIRNPDLNVGVEVLPDSILLYGNREEGQRGLPVGASARVVSLLSSGIDSPVASYRILARGCRVIYVHFHSMPYTQRASVDLTLDLVHQLAPYQPKSELYLVPLAEIQRKIAVEAQSSIRVVLYRRWMVRLAEKVAAKVGARALVTGDSIGQVASQTVENLSVIEEAATIPILRPLVATGKEEIIRMARKIGTYDISTQPYEDCCAFLMPQNPETHVRPDDVRRAEEALGPMEDLVWDALARAERHVIPCVASGAIRK
ncbi:MAG: tRNA 4-thiouridine(8) synthase ThiI [Candidatus Eisenbacteria bacterium]|uniref:Probable tRNA sulfurtransferase n=1 Tax=Eiseniibacteriota bacterium TaxID=2212470 RepID=A0A956NCN5_UNCEI|nr:tRNA 4-thiouridine(8) synthase ThiI [Candidatus Eisenbacteria bacterium]MCB9463432.1 tRNA 4-thiouridine(8) synthase ThiI [Candidatus Eisenbacteria bacterium]